MSDTAYPVLQHYGTHAERLAFTPSPISGAQPIYVWYETDTNNAYIYTTAWHGPVNASLPSLSKGGLVTNDGSSNVAIGVGTDGYVLTADSSQTDGVKWAAGGGGGVTYQVPLLSGLTWVNQGSSTAVQAGGSNTPILIDIPDTPTLNWRGLFTTQPSTPYSFIVQLNALQFFRNSQNSGVYFYDGTKLMGLELLSQASQVLQWRIEKIANVTTDSSTVKTENSSMIPWGPRWVKLTNDGSTLGFYYSLDEISPYNWVLFYSESVGAYITPTQIGVGGISVIGTSSYHVSVNILNWYTA
jgi:hypothetical protein